MKQAFNCSSTKLGLFHSLAADGQFQSALGVVDEEFLIENQSLGFFIVLGWCYAECLLFDDAINTAQKAIDRYPSSPEPWFLLSFIEGALNGVHAELNTRMLAPKEVRDNVLMKLSICRNYISIGEPDIAVEYLDEIIPENCNLNHVAELAQLYELLRRDDRLPKLFDIMRQEISYSGDLALRDFLSASVNESKSVAEIQSQAGPISNEFLALKKLSHSQAHCYSDAVKRILPNSIKEPLRDRYCDLTSYFEGHSDTSTERPLVSVISPIHRPADVENLLLQLTSQNYEQLEAVVIVNNPEIDDRRIKSRLEICGIFQNVIVEKIPSQRSLGTLLNRGLDLAQGSYFARFDADDTYLENYLSRTIAFMQRMGVSICGKTDLYCYLETCGLSIIYTNMMGGYKKTSTSIRDFVFGTSLVCSRDVAGAVRFDSSLALSEDSYFVRTAMAKGFKMAFTPPVDLIVKRSKNPASRTWNISDARLIKSSVPGLVFKTNTLAESVDLHRRSFSAV